MSQLSTNNCLVLLFRWATRYDEGVKSVKSNIIQFAALKLHAGKVYKSGDLLSNTEKLACLAQRLPIEFHSITYASKKTELDLVEGHMRILLQLNTGFESLTMVSALEPLLSEAAYWMMVPDTMFKAAEMLKSCLEGYAIHKGDRGELFVTITVQTPALCLLDTSDKSFLYAYHIRYLPYA